MPTRINVRPAQREALAPLYHRHGDCEPDTAVIRLNVASGEITYIYRDHQDTRNNLDGSLMWPLPALIRGSYLELLAQKIQPSMDRLLESLTLDDNWDNVGVAVEMNDDANAARDEITRQLGIYGGMIDRSDPSQVAVLCSVVDFVYDPPGELTATTTDAEIVILASKLEAKAAAEAIVLDGSMFNWLKQLRDQLRKQAANASKN